MQINCKDNMVSNTGIYKIKASQSSEANKLIVNNLRENNFVYRISKIFNEDGENYLYAITNDGMTAEIMFEHDLKSQKISFWKALSLLELGTKNLFDKIFEADKLMRGKESWIV